MASRERHPVRVVASLLLALAVTAGWLTASARAESHAYRLDYQGSYAWHDDFKEAAGFAHTTETLTWNWLMYTEEGSHGTSTSSSKLSAQGTLEEEGSSTPPEHCTITQASPSPKVELTPGVRPGTISYDLAIPQIGGSQLDVSGNSQNCDVFSGESALLCTLQSCGTICATGSPAAVVALRFSPASQGAFNPSATEVGSGPGRAYDLNGPTPSPRACASEERRPRACRSSPRSPSAAPPRRRPAARPSRRRSRS